MTQVKEKPEKKAVMKDSVQDEEEPISLIRFFVLKKQKQQQMHAKVGNLPQDPEVVNSRMLLQLETIILPLGLTGCLVNSCIPNGEGYLGLCREVIKNSGFQSPKRMQM